MVFGAAALNFHGLARFTEDLDLFIESKAGNVDCLKAALTSVFDDSHHVRGHHDFIVATLSAPPRAAGRIGSSI